MKENITTRNDILFFGAYILYFMIVAFKHTKLWSLVPLPSMFELLRMGAILILCIKIISDQSYTGKQIGIFCLLIMVTIISCIYCGHFELFYFMCFTFGMKDISYYKVLQVTFTIQIIVIVIVLVGILVGFLPNQMMGTIVWSNTIINDEAVGRYDLGFGHPNTASAIIFFTTVVYMCMKKSCSFIELMVVLIINYMIYQKTGSRTCFLIMIVFLPLMYLFVNKKKFQKYWQVFFVIAPLIIILTATLLQIFYNTDNKILVKINSMLSGRLWLGHQGLLNYGITLFGQSILWVDNANNEYGLPYNVVDCGYIRILLEHGIIIFIFLCIAIIRTMYYLVKRKNGKLCIAFLSLLVHSMVEPSICDISWTPFCLLMGQMVILDDDGKR